AGSDGRVEYGEYTRSVRDRTCGHVARGFCGAWSAANHYQLRQTTRREADVCGTQELFAAETEHVWRNSSDICIEHNLVSCDACWLVWQYQESRLVAGYSHYIIARS